MSQTTSDIPDHMGAAIPREAKRNVLVTLVGRGLSVGLNLLTTLAVIHYLGPDRYGIYVIVFSIVTFLDLATEISLFEIAVREIAKSDEHVSDWLGAVTWLRVGIGVIVGAALYVAPWFLPIPSEAASTLRMGSAVFIIHSLRTPITYFRAKLMIHWELGLWSLSRAIELGLVLWLIHVQGSIPSLMGAKVLASGLFVIALWAALKGRLHVPVHLGRQVMRPLILFSIPLGITALLMLVQLKGDIFLIGAILGSADAGAYGAVAQLPEFVLVATSILIATVGPLLARHLGQDDGDRFQAVFQRVFDSLLCMLPPLCAVVFVLGRPIVQLLFGSPYEPVVPEFRVMVWVGGMMPIAGLMGVTAVTLNLQRRLVRVELTNVVICVLANVVLLALLGTIASAWIRLLVVLIGPSWTYRVIRHHSPYRLSTRLLYRVIPTVVVVAGVTFGALMVHPVLAGAVGLVAYVVAVAMLRRSISAYSSG